MSTKDRETIGGGRIPRPAESDDRALLELVLQVMYDQDGNRLVLGSDEIAAELARRGQRLTPTHVGSLWRRAIECALAGGWHVPTEPRRLRKGTRKGSPDDAALTELIAWLFCRNAVGVHAREVQAELLRLGIDISWQAVSSRFARAIKDRRVITTYVASTEEKEAVELEHRMMNQLGIRRAFVVRGLPEILSAHGQAERGGLRRSTVNRAAPKVVAELERVLAELARPWEGGPALQSARVGIAWGGTLALIARHLRRSERRRGLPAHADFKPIVGLTGNGSPRQVEAFSNASAFARGFRTRSTKVTAGYLPAPAFVTKDEYAHAIQLSQVQSMLGEIKALDVVVTSLGPILSAEGSGETRFSTDPSLNEAVFQASREAEAVGEICGIPINARGNLVKTKYRTVGIDYATLQAMAREPRRHVIVVACGDRTCIEPLRAVMRGHLVTSVITDSVMAEELLKS